MGASSSTALRFNNGTTLQVVGSTVLKRTEDSKSKYNVTIKFEDGSEDEFDVVLTPHLNTLDLGLTQVKKVHQVDCLLKEDGTIELSLEHTKEQLEELDERAQQINDRCTDLLKQPSNYPRALEQSHQALALANSDGVKRIVLRNVARSLNYWGLELYNQAFQLENTGAGEVEITARLEQARDKFLEAVTNDPLQEYRKNLELIEFKIQGEEQYRRANSMEKGAFIKLVKAQTPPEQDQARTEYRHVRDEYRRALKKFEEGMKSDERFGKNVNAVKKSIDVIERILEDMERTVTQKAQDNTI